MSVCTYYVCMMTKRMCIQINRDREAAKTQGECPASKHADALHVHALDIGFVVYSDIAYSNRGVSHAPHVHALDAGFVVCRSSQ